ncbi:hypothetical protein TRFO_02236 [Tritrichomonas foetus]|uniref:RRM domain-containing protein n=1 Tax=Tritrichomonas foetus TaxID=1144522 RepID=A0A1J4JCW7_9EUKA|nr:hypothetical protein TRFO_02236 [Tritrichomonas foetus]|eukprot:OHS95253.1 hypothetical protein TRFO_02236 [Tritrichomonas foetus]
MQTASITRVVYVQGMNFNTTENDLLNFFSPCGNITKVRVMYDDFKRPKGTGYVAFETHEMALKALSLDEKLFKYRTIYVDLNRSPKMEIRMTQKEEEESYFKPSYGIRYPDEIDLRKNDAKNNNDVSNGFYAEYMKYLNRQWKKNIFSFNQNHEEEEKKDKNDEKKEEEMQKAKEVDIDDPNKFNKAIFDTIVKVDHPKNESKRKHHHHHHRKHKHRHSKHRHHNNSNYEYSSDDVYYTELPE